MNSDGETYRAAQNGNQAWFFPRDRRCRILSEILFTDKKDDKSPGVHLAKPLWTDEKADIGECAWKDGKGEIWRARRRIYEGLKQVPWTLIVSLVLVPDRRLGAKDAGHQMSRLVEYVVAPWCDFYAFGTHVGEKTGVHRHYCLALRCLDGVAYLIDGLRHSAMRYGMYRVHVSFMYKSRLALANYTVGGGRRRVFAGSKIKSVGFSSKFPKVTVEESEFARRHKQIRRIIGLKYGLRSEEEYLHADVTTKRRVNWEALNLNRAMEFS